MATITKRSVDELMQQPAGAVVRDEALTGFQARRTNGGVTYAFEYRAGSGRAAPVRRLTIGKAGPLTPDEARKAAKAHAAAVAAGDDPANKKATDKTIPTVEAFASAFLDAAAQEAANDIEAATLRPRTIGTYRSLLKCHIYPALGSRQLHRIGSDDVAKLFTSITKTKPATANRMLELVSTIYRQAGIRGWVPKGTNPAAGITANREKLRQRFLSPAELATLGEAIRKAEVEGAPYTPPSRVGKALKHVPKVIAPYRIDAYSAAALKLLIFTGARLREILHAEWANLDATAGRLRVWGKAGWRYVVLNAPALEVIGALERSGRFIIAATDPHKPKADLARPWRAVCRLAGLPGVRLHDLRHSFASVAVGGGASLPMIGALLGHTQAQTTKRYAHLADDILRTAANTVGSQIAASMKGENSSHLADSNRSTDARPITPTTRVSTLPDFLSRRSLHF